MSSPTPRRGFHDRDSIEFGRVLAFTDGVFAIAATLLVIGIAEPTLGDADSVGELADELNDLTPAFVSFVVGFAVIVRYWVAHHAFFSILGRLDRGLVWLNLVYLAFIAFLPFPTSLLGSYFENPLSVATYAVIVAVISGLEVVLFRHAHRNGLVDPPLPEDVYRWGAWMSSAPVLFFLLSIPVAFLSTGLAVALWFAGVPLMVLFNRRKPARAEELLP